MEVGLLPHLSPCVQAAVLGQGNHVVREGTDNFGLDLGSANLAVPDELSDLQRAQCSE